MKTDPEEIRKRLKEKGLKVTPQRIAILEAVDTLGNHPTADNIREYVQKKNPGIAVGTIYKVLETLEEKGFVRKINTSMDYVRYDGIMERHHHLYGSTTEEIKDYTDHELDAMLQSWFRKKKIPGFEIDEIVLQIKGKFEPEQNDPKR